MVDYWVDGSNKLDQKFSFGCVVVEDEEVIHTAHKGYENHEYCSNRNVAGECFGALYAVQHALNHGYTHINIYYDYMGIQKWGDREWKGNKPLSKMYIDSIQRAKATGLQINFIKVKAHTGVEYNELADTLAKRGLEEDKL